MTASPPRPAVGARLRRRAAAALAAAGLAACLASPRAARAADDVEPLPPMLFFPAPDAEAKKQIEETIDSSSGDVTKAIRARELLVHRWGLWSVPSLVARVEAATNVVEAWNAALVLGSLRRAYGPSHLLWPAIRPLAKALDNASGEPYLRVFCALALGNFHGPDSARRSPASREGTEEGARAAREALVYAQNALSRALLDSHAEIAVAAALALAKEGGADAAALVRERLRGGMPSQVEAKEAALLAFGLLPVPEQDVRIKEALKDGETRVRAAAALGMACWAVGEAVAETPGASGARVLALSRARAYESLLEPVQNVLIRLQDRDGAESTYARGVLAHVSGRLATWEDLLTLATLTATERGTAVAASQALLFAPVQSSVRLDMAERAGRYNSGHALKEPVLAAFLVVAGEDGSPEGIRACKEFLENQGRDPKGTLAYDVRYHAAVGLVRAFVAGRIAPEARAVAVDALVKADHHLPVGPGRTPKHVLGEIIRPAKESLSAPDGTLPASASTLLEAAWQDPDALLARDDVDTALARVDAFVRSLYRLDALPKAAAGPAGTGARTPSREDQPLRLLLGWLDAEPYFARIDFRRDRGRLPMPLPVAGRDPDLELPRR